MAGDEGGKAWTPRKAEGCGAREQPCSPSGGGARLAFPGASGAGQVEPGGGGRGGGRGAVAGAEPRRPGRTPSLAVLPLSRSLGRAAGKISLPARRPRLPGSWERRARAHFPGSAAHGADARAAGEQGLRGFSGRGSASRIAEETEAQRSKHGAPWEGHPALVRAGRKLTPSCPAPETLHFLGAGWPSQPPQS